MWVKTLLQMQISSAHDSTLACVHNSDTKTDMVEEQQVVAPIELISIGELEMLQALVMVEIMMMTT